MRLKAVCVPILVFIAVAGGSGCNPDKNKLLFKPQPNVKRTVDTEEAMSFSMNLMGVQLGFGAVTETSFGITPKQVDESGVVNMEVVLNSMEVELTGLEALLGSIPGRNAGVSVSGDDPQGLKALHAALKTVTGQPFTAKVSRFGEVLEVSGADSLAQKAAVAYKAPAGSPPADPQRIFRETIGDSAMKRALENVFVARPDKKLRAGDSWQGKIVRGNSVVEATQDTTFTVKERLNGVVTVDAVSKVDVKSNGDLLGGAGGGFQVTMEMAGGQGSGSMEFYETTGWLKDWTGTGTVPGNMSVGSPKFGKNSLPIELSYKTVVKSFET